LAFPPSAFNFLKQKQSLYKHYSTPNGNNYQSLLVILLNKRGTAVFAAVPLLFSF